AGGQGQGSGVGSQAARARARAVSRDGGARGDGDACAQAATGEAGTCSGSTAVVCNAADQCHAAGVCDPATGACSSSMKRDGTPCDDGNACTQTDTCQAGTCITIRPGVPSAAGQYQAAGVGDPATGACASAT